MQGLAIWRQGKNAMIRPIIAAIVLITTFGATPGSAAQQSAVYKNFTSFRQLVPGIDFYASNSQIVAPYEKPAAEAITRLRNLFGSDLPTGAIFICSTLAQKDSVYEPKILKMGYSWTLTAFTPEVRMQETMARIKSQMGGEVPAAIMERLKRSQEMTGEAQKQMVGSTIQQIAYAVMQTMLAKNLQYRSSRLDDMGKIPLPDWLDIGIASYASDTKYNLAFLQQNMDQSFSIEDIISMSRPFVASSSERSGGSSRGGGGAAPMGGGNGGAQGGGQGMPQGGFGGSNMGGGAQGGGQGMPQGGFGGSNMGGGAQGGGQGMPQGGSGARGQGGSPGGGGGGQRGGGMQRNLPKDQQDRMLFDGQASTFFFYMLEKVGIDKMKELIKQAREGKESREFITRPDVLGSDFEKIETDWAAWVKPQKP